MSNGQAYDRAAWIRDALARFEGRLLRYAARLTGNEETGREIVQETFLSLCREEPERIAGHLEPWLFTVCRHRALDAARRERRMATVTDTSAASTEPVPEPALVIPPGQPLAEQEAAAELQKELAGLSANKQEVIRLKFQENLTYQQISDVTGLSVSNVGFLLHTAIKELRARLEE